MLLPGPGPVMQAVIDMQGGNAIAFDTWYPGEGVQQYSRVQATTETDINFSVITKLEFTTQDLCQPVCTEPCGISHPDIKVP